MAAFSSLLFLILLLLAFSVPTQSQKPQLSRRNLALVDQEPGDQPISKPKAKKKIGAPVGRDQEEEQPITTPKPKKKLAAPIDQEQEGGRPISKPKTKKVAELTEQEQDEQPISKPKNQTKPIKPKKSNSTSTFPSIPTTKSKLNKTQPLKPPKNATNPINHTKLNTTKTQIKKARPVNPDPTPDPIWLDDPGADSDLIAEFRDLPTRIHQALIPDLKRISVTSQAYIHKANKNMAENMKPFLGNEFATKIAASASAAFLILPLCLVTVFFYYLNSFLPLQRFLIFVQAYLAIYFFTLALTALVTGLEPLRFFHATSPSSYAWTQAVQTLGYLLYLLVQLIHLVAVFSAGQNKMGVKALGLSQMIVGLAVGCHYYAAVFHRAVTGDAPRANWRVHAVYAGCFLVICLCARAERRKKAYDGGEDGKRS